MEISGSELREHRRAVGRRWKRIWSLPVIPRSMRYVAARIEAGASVLDIGASDGRFGKKLGPGTTYRTLDIDPRVHADYRSLDEVPAASVDAVVCFETIEHVDLETAIAMVRGIARVLRPGGRVYMSTPNVHHPWAYLRDATHVTPWRYDELGGLFGYAGLEVEALFRCHRDAPLKGLARRLAYPLYRALDIDYAKSLLAVARRPA